VSQALIPIEDSGKVMEIVKGRDKDTLEGGVE